MPTDTSLASAITMVEWDTPLTEADTANPMQSTNPFVVAMMWSFLAVLSPRGARSFSKAQTSSLANVWIKTFPQRDDEVDYNLEILVQRFKTFCGTERGVKIFANKAFDRVSLTILGGLTAATMKAYSGQIIYAQSPLHESILVPLSAIEVVQGHAQHLLSDFFARSSPGSEVFSPVWREAFIEKASSYLPEDASKLFGTDQATGTTIVSDRALTGTGRGSTGQESTEGGSSAGPQSTQADVSAGPQAGSSIMYSAEDSAYLMREFAGLLQGLDILKDTPKE